MRKTQIIGILLITALLVLGACAPAQTPPPFPPPPSETPALAPEETPAPPPPSPAPAAGVAVPAEEEAPKITELGENTAIDIIKAYPEVLDAAIAQDGHDLSLAIIVPKSTSEARAKELGDAFVRLVKTFGLLDSDKSEPSPGKEIGEGIFNYLITVAYPDQAIIAQGAKVSFATHITW